MRHFFGVLLVSLFASSAHAAKSASVSCKAHYSKQGVDVGQATTFAGNVLSVNGGTAIEQNFTVEGITANVHVYYAPATHFISINYYHQPTDTALINDSFIQPGQRIILFARTSSIAPIVDAVEVSCMFE